jgi:hypothetical protein
VRTLPMLSGRCAKVGLTLLSAMPVARSPLVRGRLEKWPNHQSDQSPESQAHSRPGQEASNRPMRILILIGSLDVLNIFAHFDSLTVR